MKKVQVREAKLFASKKNHIDRFWRGLRSEEKKIKDFSFWGIAKPLKHTFLLHTFFIFTTYTTYICDRADPRYCTYFMVLVCILPLPPIWFNNFATLLEHTLGKKLKNSSIKIMFYFFPEQIVERGKNDNDYHTKSSEFKIVQNVFALIKKILSYYAKQSAPIYRAPFFFFLNCNLLNTAISNYSECHVN